MIPVPLEELGLAMLPPVWALVMLIPVFIVTGWDCTKADRDCCACFTLNAADRVIFGVAKLANVRNFRFIPVVLITPVPGLVPVTGARSFGDTVGFDVDFSTMGEFDV